MNILIYLYNYNHIYRGYIMGGFVYDLSKGVLSAMSERSERVADIISEQMDKDPIQIHPLL